MLGVAVALAATLAQAQTLEGRLTDGARPLAGVRVFPDRGMRVRPTGFPPVAVTDGEGRFRLDLAPTDDLLILEKSGFQRDMVPVAAWTGERALRRAPAHRVEKVLVVRLSFPDQPEVQSDDALRSVLFGRQPGVASAANHLYEASKGSLELVEGALLHLTDPTHPSPRDDGQREDMCGWVLRQLKGLDLTDFDGVDNSTGALRPDGRPDHLWVIPPGPPRSVTVDPTHLTAVSYLLPLPWEPTRRWGLLFFTEETPLGNIVHEAFHGMGQHRVDDFYRGCDDPHTAGIWDVMDAGQFRGWDALRPKEGPWQAQVGYSPSMPMGWTRAELWYRGRFKATVPTRTLTGRGWTGWIAPLSAAAGEDPQRVLVPDPRRKGRFWELNVRRAWGFDRGRTGDRFGPGHEGLVVARIDPALLTLDGDSKGPVRVMDAHPGTPEPPQPRFPCERWQLDDAAFNQGTGQVAQGADGPLRWEVLEADAAGRMKVRIQLGLTSGREPGR